ncbi:hypothetical protein ACFC08_18760 [Streptomyces sp. NPDC056112]|uniref:hypothetical protein n=1 Tax=unclassified Streptomyces TaxID=2593676 RepID=UPI0011411584|nr:MULTISPECIES: hypothetical protein [unclassified Streptomyces]GED88762.1 hypothetical protein TNCT6_58470 [Streptomyces sp. 6-11-2]
MKAVWTLLTFLFGLFTLGAVGSTIQAVQNSPSGAHNSYSIGSGIIDGLLRVLFIAALALATRACYQRASRTSQSAPGPDKRPWQR